VLLLLLLLMMMMMMGLTLISGFRRDVDIICGLLGDYTASCGNNYLTTPCNHQKTTDYMMMGVLGKNVNTLPSYVTSSRLGS
jgi:hypothetical protein